MIIRSLDLCEIASAKLLPLRWRGPLQRHHWLSPVITATAVITTATTITAVIINSYHRSYHRHCSHHHHRHYAHYSYWRQKFTGGRRLRCADETADTPRLPRPVCQSVQASRHNHQKETNDMAETAAPPKTIERIPLNFQLDDKLIDGATIRPSTFANFSGAIAAAHQMTTPPAFSARLLRVRMSR